MQNGTVTLLIRWRAEAIQWLSTHQQQQLLLPQQALMCDLTTHVLPYGPCLLPTWAAAFTASPRSSRRQIFVKMHSVAGDVKNTSFVFSQATMAPGAFSSWALHTAHIGPLTFVEEMGPAEREAVGDGREIQGARRCGRHYRFGRRQTGIQRM